MIKTRGRKILRDVWARKGRTALVSIAIFIGVAGTIALFSMSDILVSKLREDIKEDELAMAIVQTNVDASVQLDNVKYLQQLQEQPGVTEVIAGIEDYFVYYSLKEGSDDFEEGWIQSYQVLTEKTGTEEGAPVEYELRDAPFEARSPIEPFGLIEGEFPERRQNEVVIERRMAEDLDLGVGDNFYFRIPSPSRDSALGGATGTVEVWTISGVVFDPYATTPKLSIYAFQEDVQYLTGLSSYANFWFRFTDFATAEDQFDAVLDFMAEETPYVPVFSFKEDPAQNQLLTSVQTLGGLLSFLALLALVVSGFLVVNVVTSIVVEQKRQIGVMKSMGATRADNFFMYSGIAFTYGLIGVIPGVIVGIPGGSVAAQLLAPELNTYLEEGLKVSPLSIILGIVVGLMVPVVASLIPVFNGTRVKVLDAMTDLGISTSYGYGPLARLVNLLPIPITVRQGFSNVIIKKSRMAFTVITLSIAVGAFMGIFAIFETMVTGIGEFIDTFNVQIGILPSDARDPDEFKAVLEENFGEDIKELSSGVQLQVEFEGFEPPPATGGPPGIFAYGVEIDPDAPQAFKFELSKGSDLTPENGADGIILSSALASAMDKDVNDTVVLKLPGSVTELTVVGIADFPINQVWMYWETLAVAAGYTFDTIDSEVTSPFTIPPQQSNFIKYASQAQVGDDTQPTLVFGLTPATQQFLMFTEGDFFTFFDGDQANERATNGVIVSDTFAEQTGLGEGDTIKLTSTASNGQSGDYLITGVFNASILAGGQGQQSPLSGVGIIGMYWRDLTTFDGASVVSEPRPQFYFLTTNKSDATVDEIDDIMDNMTSELANKGIPVASFNFVEFTEQISAAFFTIQVVLQAVALLIALVGALGLLTTLSMSVFERQKEIGVMRSIGAGSGTVATQFLTEGLIVGMIAWVVGLPLMVGIQWVLLEITDFSDVFPLEISPMAIILGLVGMIVITTIASIGPSLGAARKTVSDILRYQ